VHPAATIIYTIMSGLSETFSLGSSNVSHSESNSCTYFEKVGIYYYSTLFVSLLAAELRAGQLAVRFVQG